MGSTSIASPGRSLSDSLLVNNAALPSVGSPIVGYKYTGSSLNFDLTLAALGAPTVPTFPTVPADAVAIEVWAASDSVADGVAFACRSGQISNTGVLATNTSNNIGTTGSVPSQFVVGGARMVIPLPSVGAAIPAGWRFSALNTVTKMQGRYLSQAALYPYFIGGTEEFLLVGAGAQTQLPFATAAKFPINYVGARFQVIGAGVRFTLDGSTPAAAVGDFLPAGVYYIDQAKHGVSIAALKFYQPASTFIVGNSLLAAP